MEKYTMRRAIAGTGYVGLVTDFCLAYTGQCFCGVDTDERRIDTLKNGKSPIYEADLEKYMAPAKQNITYISDYKATYKDADVIFIALHPIIEIIRPDHGIVKKAKSGYHLYSHKGLQPLLQQILFDVNSEFYTIDDNARRYAEENYNCEKIAKKLNHTFKEVEATYVSFTLGRR